MSRIFPFAFLAFISALGQVSAQQPPGGLVTSWGSSGTAVVTLPNPYAGRVVDVAEGTDGGLFLADSIPGVAGSSIDRSALTKLTSTGVLDTNFNSIGSEIFTPPTQNGVYRSAVTMLSGSQVLLAYNSASGFNLLKVSPTGVIFFSRGLAVSNASSCPVRLVKEMGNGNILVLGTPVGIATSFPLVQFTPEGDPVETFGTHGVRSITASFPNQFSSLSMDVQADGKILVGGANKVPSPKLLLRRFNSDGSPDTTFGTNGVVTSRDMTELASIDAMETNTNGEALAVGKTTGNQVALMRFLADGTLDPNFSNGGMVITYLGNSSAPVAGVTQRTDGRIFVASTIAVGSVSSFGLVRHLPDGTLDSTFGSGGIASAVVAAGENVVSGLRFSPNGDVYVVGQAKAAAGDTRSSLAVVRFYAGANQTYIKPSVLASPTSKTVARHAAVTLTVSVEANALPTWYRWKKEGTLIPSVTGPSLSIASAEPADEGTYSVEVGNYAGSTLNEGIVLTVTAPPVITSEATSPEVYSGPRGAKHDFTVNVTGHAPFTYQWQLNYENLGAARQNSTGTDTLTVPVEYFAPEVHALTYRVIITNRDGSSSRAFALIPLPNVPKVVVQPLPVERFAYSGSSGSVALTATISGYAPFLIQWQKDGRNFGQAAQQKATAVRLDIPLVASNSGQYRCIISNSDGIVTTDTVTVRLNADPSVYLSESRLLLNEGGLLSISTWVNSSIGGMSYRWQVPNPHVHDITYSALLISRVTLADAGNYTVTFTTAKGRATSPAASLAVVEKANHAVSVMPGKTAMLAIKAAGEGLSFAWQRVDRRALNSARFIGLNTPTLKITGAVNGDEGEYYCAVTRTGVPGPPLNSGITTLGVDSQKPVFDPPVFGAGTVAVRYTVQLHASNSPTRYAATNLPRGVTCDPLTGLIDGTPIVTGTFNVSVSATNVVGTTTAGPFKVIVSAFPHVLAGNYAGPLQSGSIPPTLNLSITPSGAFTAKVVYSTGFGTLGLHSFAGQLGGADSENLLATIEEVSWGMTLKWSVVGGIEASVAGPYFIDGVGYFEPHQNAWKATTHPATAFAGYYTVELVQSTVGNAIPADATGSGYASFSPRTDGTLTVTGKLPDGTVFTIPAFLDADGTIWAHAWLYGNKGFFDGTFKLSTGTATGYLDSAVTGDVFMARPPNTLSSMGTVAYIANTYFNGYGNSLLAKGARYLPPAKGLLGSSSYMINASASSPNVSITLKGGGFSELVGVDAALKTNHTVTFPAFVPGGPVKYASLTFTPTTGLFSGAFTRYAYDDNQTVVGSYSSPFQGIVTRADATQPTGYGAGFFTRTHTHVITEDGSNKVLYRVPLLESGRVFVNLKVATP